MTVTPPPPVSALRRKTTAVLLGAAALALAGCATTAQAPEDLVTQRVEQRWDALMQNDFERAWTYTQPGYKAIVAQRDYHKRFGGGGRWKGVQIHDVQCQPERCLVKLRLTSTVMVPPFRGKDLVGHITETWVREDGQWWYYQAL